MDTKVELRAVPGWMCDVDFTWELGEAAGGTTIFASEEDLRRCRKCTTFDNEEHAAVEVFTMSKEDYLQLLEKAGIDPNDVRASNIGPIFWSKDNLEKGLTNSIS